VLLFERFQKSGYFGLGVSPGLLFGGVVRGAGITILPEIPVIDDLEQGKLVRLNWDEGGLETALHMIWFKARWRPPALEAFMNMIREHFRRDWAAA
jgi:DNA-binding transcriptional LysR family regulator